MKWLFVSDTRDRDRDRVILSEAKDRGPHARVICRGIANFHVTHTGTSDGTVQVKCNTSRSEARSYLTP